MAAWTCRRSKMGQLLSMDCHPGTDPDRTQARLMGNGMRLVMSKVMTSTSACSQRNWKALAVRASAATTS